MNAVKEIEFDAFEREVRTFKDNLSSELGLDPSLFWVWTKKQKLTSHKGIAMPLEDDEETSSLVRIHDENGTSHLAVLDPRSMVGKFCTTWHFTVRIYALIEKDEPRRDDMQKRAQSGIDELWRKYNT